jgi:hypothetical protein
LTYVFIASIYSAAIIALIDALSIVFYLKVIAFECTAAVHISRAITFYAASFADFCIAVLQ